MDNCSKEKLEEFSKKHKSKNKLGYVKYTDWIELDNLLYKYNRFLYKSFL